MSDQAAIDAELAAARAATQLARDYAQTAAQAAASAKQESEAALVRLDNLSALLTGGDPGLPVISIADAEPVQAGQVAMFAVTLSHLADAPIIFELAAEHAGVFVLPPGGWEIGTGSTKLLAEVQVLADAPPGPVEMRLLVDETDATIGDGVARCTILSTEEPGEPDLSRGLLYSLPAPISVPIDLPAGQMVGVQTICMVVKVKKTTGRHKKFIGCASSQSAGQGAFGIGINPQGTTDVWRAGGGQQNPFTPQSVFPARKAVALTWQVAGNELAFGLDGATTPLAQPLAASDGPSAIGAGYWAGKRVDPIAPEDEIRACDCWDRPLNEAELALWKEQHAHLEDQEPDPEEPGNGGGSPGDPPPVLPATGGRIVRVANRAELLAAWSAAQAKDHIIMAPGSYGAVRLSNPKPGVRIEADGRVSWDGGHQLPHAIDGIADDVSIVGELSLSRYGPAQASIHAEGPNKGRLTQETAVILAERSWPTYSKRWMVIGVSVSDCPMREGIRLKGSYHEVHGASIRNCSSVGLVFNSSQDGRIGNCTFKDINTSRGASHHHSGAIKCLGGYGDEINQVDRNKGARWPASKGVQIWKCEGRNLLSCRGLVWLDWDHDGFLIEDCLVDGSDFEAIALEASARITIRRLTAYRTNRTAYHHAVAFWNSAVMFQNSKGCELLDSQLTLGQACKAAIGVQNWNREDYNANIGDFLGCGNWWHDCQVQGPVLKSHLGNGGPVQVVRTKPHPAAEEVAYNNWQGPNFG